LSSYAGQSSCSRLAAGDGLDRDRAIAIIEELQRLQRSDRRYREVVDQLRALTASIKGQ
jgi:hypothetical protein